MKRIIPAILLLLSLTGCYNSGEPRERVLKIYNWADYIGDGVLEDFQAYYKEQTGENIRIVYQDVYKRQGFECLCFLLRTVGIYSTGKCSIPCTDNHY